MASRSTGAAAGSRSTSSNRRAPAARRLRAKKRFGQHFLSDENILNRIADAAEIGPSHTVLEVGPGRGSLTAILARRARRVVAVEVDSDLIRELRERFAAEPHVAVLEADVLAHAPSELLARGRAGPPYLLVANLPYNIASAVLRHFLEGDVRPERLVVMVQREVAEAIVARPGEMSLLSVAVQAYGEARIVMKVAPGAFSPPPNVQSALVRIDVARRPRVDAPIDAFFAVARAGFSGRRKQVRNSLANGLRIGVNEAGALIAGAGIDARLRPQRLSLDDWSSITHAWLRRRAL